VRGLRHNEFEFYSVGFTEKGEQPFELIVWKSPELSRGPEYRILEGGSGTAVHRPVASRKGLWIPE
jgi:hypothetical protein